MWRRSVVNTWSALRDQRAIDALFWNCIQTIARITCQTKRIISRIDCLTISSLCNTRLTICCWRISPWTCSARNWKSWRSIVNTLSTEINEWAVKTLLSAWVKCKAGVTSLAFWIVRWFWSLTIRWRSHACLTIKLRDFAAWADCARDWISWRSIIITWCTWSNLITSQTLISWRMQYVTWIANITLGMV